jgi:hypothetical protein
VEEGNGKRVDFDKGQKSQFIDLLFKFGNNFAKISSEGCAKL